MNTLIFAQLAAPASGAIETWLLSAAAVASIALLTKKLFLTKLPREPEFVTRTEFHQEMKEVREKIDAGFLKTRELMDVNQNILFRSAEARTASIHYRLRGLEESVARLDERTKS